MQTFNNAEMAFLSLLCYPKLSLKSLKLCANNAVLYPPAIWPHLATMWQAYLDTLTKCKQEGTTPGKDTIIANLTEAVMADTKMPEELVEKCDVLLQRFKDGDVPTEEEGLEKTNNTHQYMSNTVSFLAKIKRMCTNNSQKES